MREWTVAAGLIEGPGGLLLVQNRRRDGSLDWSPPGGVVEPDEAVADGLTREVLEETGLRVTAWRDEPAYRVDVVADELGWHAAVFVFRALVYEGALDPRDPDGIVVDARFVPAAECDFHLRGGQRWVIEPLALWLSGDLLEPFDVAYSVAGERREALVVTRR